ncbi:MAG: hypothetical protein ACLFNU_07985 [Bacteroidales bacterium]
MVFSFSKVRIYKLLIVLVFVLFSTKIIAATPFDDHSGHNHHHGEWEIALVGGGVFLFHEDELALGTHLHLLRSIDKVKGLNLGVGLEAIFANHIHFSASIAAKYEFWKNFGILLAPGVQFVNHHNSWESAFSAHFELIYEFKVGRYHIGPAVGYSISKEDKHASLGLHVGYSF